MTYGDLHAVGTLLQYTGRKQRSWTTGDHRDLVVMTMSHVTVQYQYSVMVILDTHGPWAFGVYTRLSFSSAAAEWQVISVSR